MTERDLTRREFLQMTGATVAAAAIAPVAIRLGRAGAGPGAGWAGGRR